MLAVASDAIQNDPKLYDVSKHFEGYLSSTPRLRILLLLLFVQRILQQLLLGGLLLLVLLLLPAGREPLAHLNFAKLEVCLHVCATRLDSLTLAVLCLTFISLPAGTAGACVASFRPELYQGRSGLAKSKGEFV